MHTLLASIRFHWTTCFKLLKKQGLFLLPFWLVLLVLNYLYHARGFDLSLINIYHGLGWMDALMLGLLIVLSLICHIMHQILYQGTQKVTIGLSHIVERALARHFSYVFILIVLLFLVGITFIPLMVLINTAPAQNLVNFLNKSFHLTSPIALTLLLCPYIVIPGYVISRLFHGLVLSSVFPTLSPSDSLRVSLKVTQGSFVSSFMSIWLPLTVLHLITYIGISASIHTTQPLEIMVMLILLPITLGLTIVQLAWLQMHHNVTIQDCIKAVDNATLK